MTGFVAESNEQGVTFVVNGNIRQQGIHKNLFQNIKRMRSSKSKYRFSTHP